MDVITATQPDKTIVFSNSPLSYVVIIHSSRNIQVVSVQLVPAEYHGVPVYIVSSTIKM